VGASAPIFFMKDSTKEFITIMFIIATLFLGALYFVSFWGDDIDSKNNETSAKQNMDP
jgi:hypothetical protein